jgi:hypothetical protein
MTDEPTGDDVAATPASEPSPEPAPARPAVPAAPDPAEYDTERNAAARARGLAAPYIAGGRDPDPEAGLAEERRYLRLLLIMVGVIIASGFVIGILANVVSVLTAG